MIDFHTYTAFGLTVRVPFPCPSLAPAPPDREVDVEVRDGSVPRTLEAASVRDGFWEASPGLLLVRGGARGGRWLISGSDAIDLERGSAAEEERLEYWLLHRALPAVLRHRGQLVLHANAALTTKGAVVIAGESGAGKSTTLAALLSRGCQMVTDDVTVLRASPTGAVEVMPGPPHLALSAESASAVGRDIAALPRHPWRRLKAAVPAHLEMASGPVPLSAIYVLATGPDDHVGVSQLEGREKFDALLGCVYGPMLAEEHPRQFSQLAAVASQVSAARVSRPADRWSVAEVVEAILQNGG